MKKPFVGFTLVMLLVASGCDGYRRDVNPAGALIVTHSSFDRPSPTDKLYSAHAIKLEDAELAQVVTLYAEVSARSVIRGGNVPNVKVTFSNQTPMGTVEVLRALDTVLAAQDITTVYLGTQYVKIVPARQAVMESGPVLDVPPDQLPDSSSFVTYIVRVKGFKPSEVIPALGPFAKFPGGLVAIDPKFGRPSSAGMLTNFPTIFGAKDKGILILRDYSSNVRRMVQMLQKLEQQ